MMRSRCCFTPAIAACFPCSCTTPTLLCGDLFTQGGAACPPVTGSDILGPSELFRKPMDYFAHAAHSGTALEKLAALQPELLACQHGSSYRGDGAALLRE